MIKLINNFSMLSFKQNKNILICNPAHKAWIPIIINDQFAFQGVFGTYIKGILCRICLKSMVHLQL